MLSLIEVESCHLRTNHCISHPLVGLIVWLRRCTCFSKFISTNWLSFQSLWSLCRCLLCHRDVAVLYIESMLPIVSHHSLLCSYSKEVETWFGHSLVLLTLHVGHFPVLILVHAHYVRFLPHYIALLSTSCWMMTDALIPSFQWISSHRLQFIYSGIGI